MVANGLRAPHNFRTSKTRRVTASLLNSMVLLALFAGPSGIWHTFAWTARACRPPSQSAHSDHERREEESKGAARRAAPLVKQVVTYSQTAGKALLHGSEAAVREFFDRPSTQLMRDIADGYNSGKAPGQARMVVTDAEPGEHTISYPEGWWEAPYNLGKVMVTGPEISVRLQDLTPDQEPQVVPAEDFSPKWHCGRVRVLSVLRNGEDMCQVTLTLPLVPEINFNVSIYANFTMEQGFAGGDEHFNTMGLEGDFGLSIPQFPGARKVMSLFLPGYLKRAMQQAADGLATSFDKVTQRKV